MGFVFQDRVPTYPNRYKLTNAGGESEYVTLERADEPRVVGTPLNADTFNTAFAEVEHNPEVVNLLDNSNFMNPVNQKGKTSYPGGGRSLDRWLGPIAILPDGGISLEGLGGLSMSQRVTFDLTDGVKRTVAIGTTDGAVYCTELSTQWHVYLGESGYGVSVFVGSYGQDVCIGAAAPDEVCPLAWAALYEGVYTVNTLPKYKPKPYSAELEECQRYYQIRSTNNVPAVDLRPTMRLANPTITAVAGGYAYSAEL